MPVMAEHTPGAVIPITGTPNSDEIFAEAAARGNKNVLAISSIVGANELERRTISDFERLIRHGAKFIDLHVRRDGQEYRFEADWLGRLFRADLPSSELASASPQDTGEGSYAK